MKNQRKNIKRKMIGSKLKKGAITLCCLLPLMLSAEDLTPSLPLVESDIDHEEDKVVEEVQISKSVGKAAEEGAHTARNRIIYRCSLAAGAIAIGVTALVLVSQHKGHHSHQ